MDITNLQQSELWEVASKFISFDSVSSKSDDEAANYLASYLEEIGFTIRKFQQEVDGVPKTMVVAWIGPKVPGGMIISGHIDIVPFDGQPGWTTNPLEMTLDGDNIIGRGVTDMKVFIAQAIVAAKNIQLDQLKRPLVFIFTCDEEVAGQGANRLVEVLPEYFKEFPLPEVAWIGEPTSNAIFPAHKGYTTFEIRVHGKGGHSSIPKNGLNAIDTMADILRIVREIGADLDANASEENKKLFPSSPASTFNTGLIQGGLAPNMIADACQATMSIRVSPGDDAYKIIATIQKRVNDEIVSKMKQFADSCDVFFENVISMPPLVSPRNSPFANLLSKVYDTEVSLSAPYGTDGGPFQSAGINSYICGPGLLEQAHQPNESLPVENFITGVDKITRVIQSWCIDENA
jgi:acetylornithine deacetylase